METPFANMLPESKRAAVIQALQETFGAYAITTCELLTRGLSPALVYKIIVNEQPYVLRLVMQPNKLSDPAREYVCLKYAADAGIAPPVYYANATEGFSITGFITSQPFPPKPEMLNMLAEVLRKVHALPAFPGLIHFVDGVQQFIKRYKETNMYPDSVTAEHFSYINEISKRYPRKSELVSSHNDMNPANVLFDGKQLWLIDWEAAFLNDRYVDLAITTQFFASEKTQTAQLLNGYFGQEPNEKQQARFYLMQQVCFIYYATIFLRLAADSKPAGFAHDAQMQVPGMQEVRQLLINGARQLGSYEGQLLYGKMLLQEALQRMRHPAFAAALEKFPIA